MNVPDQKQPVVLTADDDPVTSQILLAYLECEGYHVLIAEDGDQAVALAKSTPPDAVILDYNLPPTTGADVARALRADPTTAHAGIALLTGSAEIAEACGDDDLWNARLTKPVEQEFLAEVVATLINGARARSAEHHNQQESDSPLPEDPIQAEFVTRVRGKLDDMRELARCESSPNSPGSPLRVLRRHLQQLQGSAAMCGFPQIGEHAAEAAGLLDQCLRDIESGTQSELSKVRDLIEQIALLAKRSGRSETDCAS
jgi:CheY-like chemotaxis protein